MAKEEISAVPDDDPYIANKLRQEAAEKKWWLAGGQEAPDKAEQIFDAIRTGLGDGPRWTGARVERDPAALRVALGALGIVLPSRIDGAPRVETTEGEEVLVEPVLGPDGPRVRVDVPLWTGGELTLSSAAHLMALLALAVDEAREMASARIGPLPLRVRSRTP